jgi:DegV family protein with EDD domain
MSRVAVLTDSTAYIPDPILKQYNIFTIPLFVVWNGQSLRDGVDITPQEFYQRLATAKTMPTTSQPSAQDMKNAFQNLLDQGYDVLGIFISSKLSGTVQSAHQALEMMPQAASRIAVVDSLSTAMAMGFQVVQAARAAQQGASLTECQQAALTAQANSSVYFVVDTLEFLHRGGRIGGAQALLGTALNIKPLLELRAGRIEAVEKIRTKSKAIERMIELTAERVAGRTPVRLAAVHANAEAEAQALLEAAAAKMNPVETFFASVSPVIGVHTGPGVVGLAFMSGV